MHLLAIQLDDEVRPILVNFEGARAERDFSEDLAGAGEGERQFALVRLDAFFDLGLEEGAVLKVTLGGRDVADPAMGTLKIVIADPMFQALAH